MIVLLLLALVIIGFVAPDLFDEIIDRLEEIRKAVMPSIVLIR